MTRLSLDLLIFESGGALAGRVETHGRAMAAKNSPSASPAPLPAVTSVRASMEESVLAGSAARRARGMLLAACMRARTAPCLAAERLRGAPSIGAVLDHQALRLPCAAFCARA